MSAEESLVPPTVRQGRLNPKWSAGTRPPTTVEVASAQRPATTCWAPDSMRCAHSTALVASEAATEIGVYCDFVLSFSSRLNVGAKSAPA